MAASKKPVDDVSKPGEATPSSTSRPIINDHRASINQADPMVTEHRPGTKSPILANSERKIIAPLTDTEKAETTVATDKPAEEATVESSASDKETKTEEKPAEQASEGAAVVDAVADQAADKRKQAEVDKKEQEHQEELHKLIEEKTYNLPIGEAKRKRNTRISTGMLILLLAIVVGAYLAIDAGLIKVNIPLPYQFFK
jgi:hypothetical protein